MTTALRLSPVPGDPPGPRLPAETLARLAELRVAALACRAASRTDIFKACAVLSATPGHARAAFADALVRCLAPALGRAPVFLRPGEAELSFDEAWLGAALRAVQTGDDASLAFLIRARIPFEHRRAIGFLLRGLMEDD